MHTASLGPVSLRYAVRGDGPTALFLHGYPLDHTVWSDQLAALADVRRCVAPDLRGFGASDPGTEDSLTMELHARDMVALLDRLEVERADVVGLSMGGYVALALWELAPQRVRSLALVDTRAGADDEKGRAGRDAAKQKLLEVGRAAFAAGLGAGLLGPDATPRAHARLRTMAEGTRYESILASLEGMKVRKDRTALLASIDVPALVVCGEHDGLTPPATGRALADALPNARYEELAGAGHLTPLEAPEELAAALRRHWRG